MLTSYNIWRNIRQDMNFIFQQNVLYISFQYTVTVQLNVHESYKTLVRKSVQKQESIDGMAFQLAAALFHRATSN